MFFSQAATCKNRTKIKSGIYLVIIEMHLIRRRQQCAIKNKQIWAYIWVNIIINDIKTNTDATCYCL